MPVTIKFAFGKTKTIGSSDAGTGIDANPPKAVAGLKLKQAIQNPHQFTVKVPLGCKAPIKALAAKLGVTTGMMITEALADLIAHPLAEIFHVPAPKNSERFVFKVTPEMAHSVHQFAAEKNVSRQSVILCALDKLLAKHDINLG